MRALRVAELGVRAIAYQEVAAGDVSPDRYGKLLAGEGPCVDQTLYCSVVVSNLSFELSPPRQRSRRIIVVTLVL